ncbi:hypothetical protein N5C66_05770 [Rhizobium pusense]|uniref:hypothetical protein n=1 Tax=Agrobacterium pusense TaxID=648995 RepID=UPI0024487E27|nr:hypothetical protein [Agrobacterium pusense]MDH1097405.1 hypothetical protein [Agrobacterium pusense]MDH1111235.1 hypothetical protein [Agrobacterium pusense]MDH2193438.1 hypothetical protein [Agrobacterium pusense]
MTTPTRNNRYQLPSWPPTEFTVDLWNAVFGDLADRITDREQLEATFETLKAQGIQASLDYIQINVAPQIVNLQQSITVAQNQIDQIIIGGKAPDTLKFGGQLPAYYATAQALSQGLAEKVPTTRKVNGKDLSGDIALEKADVGLGNVNNTADADKPISSDQATAFAKRVRVDAGQVLTDAEKGQARANIGVSAIAGYRNKIINGNFDIWQRGVSQTASGYGSDDRWANLNTGNTKVHSLQTFAIGQSEVPGNPTYFSRTVVTSVVGAGNECIKAQRIENVGTLNSKKATVSFYAKADAPKNIALELNQYFGPSGSSRVFIPLGLVALTTSWKRYDVVVDIPGIAGKTIDANNFLELVFWFNAGSNFSSRASNLGQQSGTFDIARVSLVEGDATAEADPYSARHVQQELLLCQRYCCLIFTGLQSGATGTTLNYFRFPTEMRVTPSRTAIGLGTVVNAAVNNDFGSASNRGGYFQINVTAPGGYVDGYAMRFDAEL